VARLFSKVQGFSVAQRTKTETEEIDIIILNDSNDPRFRREGAMVIAECKNWASRCGKNEIVIFREKVENRNGRCTIGFLISWNGFTETVTKEMLRGSREYPLIIPLTGVEIKEAVQTGDFLQVLSKAWDKAVAL